MNCEEIKQKIGIRTVLESFGLFPVKENGKTGFYFALDREEKIPSFSVDFIKNQAFDFGTGKSYDIISIVQLMNRCSVSDALTHLKTFDFSIPVSKANAENSEAISYEIVRITEVRHPALIQYLQSRKVAEQKHLVREVRYKMHGRKYFGVGFFNNSDGLEIRNLYSKSCLGKKDVTLILSENRTVNEITVFEGFFDYLTYLNLEKNGNSACDFLILNSTAMLFKAEEKLREYDKILLFLDNDANGRSVTTKIRSQYKNVEDCSLLYRDYEDLNAWFCNDQKIL